MLVEENFMIKRNKTQNITWKEDAVIAGQAYPYTSHSTLF